MLSNEEKINKINESDTFIRLIENGAGVPLANLLFSILGASKTIYSSESYYSKESFNNKFGKINHRTVSVERLSCINNDIYVNNDFKLNLYNTILSSTFQIGGLDNNDTMSTHGWLCLNIKNESIKYYHISIHDKLSRIQYQTLIGNICLDILYCNNKTIPKNCYIDIVLDKKGLYNHTDVIESIISSDFDIPVIFKTDGSHDRLESVTRDTNELIIYKGSYFPITAAHQEIMAKIMELYPDGKPIFSISMNTHGKGKVDMKSLLFRIQCINKLGFDVLVHNNPLYKETINLIRQKFKGKIIIPQGSDTVERFMIDYFNDELVLNSNKIIEDIKYGIFNNVDFILADRRTDISENTLFSNFLNEFNYKNIETSFYNISSTKVRDLIKDNHGEWVKGLVDDRIIDDIIKHFKK